MALQIGSHTANGRRGQYGKLGGVRITSCVGDFEAVPAFSEVHTFNHLRTLVFPFALSTDKEGQSLDCRASRYRWWILVERSLARNKLQVKETMEGGVFVSIKKKKKVERLQ